MPSFSDFEEEEEETEEEFNFHKTLGTQLLSMRHLRHTSTTHRQGRAMVSSGDDDDDGDDGGAARGGDDVNWENIEEDEE